MVSRSPILASEPRRSALELIDEAVLSLARHWLRVALSFNAFVLLLASAAAVFRAANHHTLADLIYLLYRPLCHQHPERSLSIMGEPMAFCFRDFAIFSGALAIGLLFAAARSRRVTGNVPKGLVVTLLLPMVLDGVTQLVGLRESTNAVRLITGGLFGAGVALATLPALDHGFQTLRQDIESRRKRVPQRRHGVST